MECKLGKALSEATDLKQSGEQPSGAKCCVVAASSQAKIPTTLRYVLNESARKVTTIFTTNWPQSGETTGSIYISCNN